MLGSPPATQRYKVRLCHIKTQEIAVFCGEDLYSSPGDLLLNGRLLHSRRTDPDSVCGRLSGSMPAIQQYKVHLCCIRTQEFAVFCGGCIRYQAGDILLDSRLLHNRLTDFDTLCERILGSTPATQWYKVRPCRIETQEFAVFCGGYISYQAGDILLDSVLLHNRLTDFDTLCRRLLGSTPATQRYKVCLCRIKIHESTNPSESGLWTKVMESPMTDSSTTA